MTIPDGDDQEGLWRCSAIESFYKRVEKGSSESNVHSKTGASSGKIISRNGVRCGKTKDS